MLHSERSNGLLESASNAHSVVAVTALRLATSLIGSAKWFLRGCDSRRDRSSWLNPPFCEDSIVRFARQGSFAPIGTASITPGEGECGSMQAEGCCSLEARQPVGLIPYHSPMSLNDDTSSV